MSFTPGFRLHIVESLKSLFVIVTSLCLQHAFSEDFLNMDTYDMDYYCGQTLDLEDSGLFQVQIRFRPDNVVLTGGSCNFTLSTWYYKMAVRPVYFEDNGVDCDRRLEMYHISPSESPKENKTPIRTYCYGSLLNSEVFFVDKGLLLLKYFYGAQSPEGSFRIIVTLYQTGACLSDEVRCTNGHCIKSSIYCNGHKPCGDDEEEGRCFDKTEPENQSITSIVLAIVVTVLVLVILGGTLYGCCCRNSRFRNADSSGIQGPSRFWHDIFTSRGTTPANGETNEGADFNDEPPDYNSLDLTNNPPAYDDVIQDAVKYKVNEQTIQYI